jgi:hypothetical protein
MMNQYVKDLNKEYAIQLVPLDLQVRISKLLIVIINVMDSD